MLKLNKDTIEMLNELVKPCWLTSVIELILDEYKNNGRRRIFSCRISKTFLKDDLKVSSITLDFDSTGIFEERLKANVWYKADKFDGNPTSLLLLQKRNRYDESMRYMFTSNEDLLHKLDYGVDEFMLLNR